MSSLFDRAATLRERLEIAARGDPRFRHVDAVMLLRDGPQDIKLVVLWNQRIGGPLPASTVWDGIPVHYAVSAGVMGDVEPRTATERELSDPPRAWIYTWYVIKSFAVAGFAAAAAYLLGEKHGREEARRTFGGFVR